MPKLRNSQPKSARSKKPNTSVREVEIRKPRELTRRRAMDISAG